MAVFKDDSDTPSPLTTFKAHKPYGLEHALWAPDNVCIATADSYSVFFWSAWSGEIHKSFGPGIRDPHSGANVTVSLTSFPEACPGCRPKAM